MKHIWIAAALLATGATPVLAQMAPAAGTAAVQAKAPGKEAVATVTEMRARIVAVDKTNRTVTVKGAKGNEVVLLAGDEVRNFDQIKVGQDVVLRYVQALALELKKGAGGGIRERVESVDSARAKPGENPAGVAGRQVTVTADVVDVNMKNRTVTLRGPKRTLELKVDNADRLKNVKKGDQVQATYTEAVALSVEPAPMMEPKKK